MTVYLCGAINGCSDSECRDWREYAKQRLAGVAEVLDPMRRDYRGREDDAEFLEGMAFCAVAAEWHPENVAGLRRIAADLTALRTQLTERDAEVRRLREELEAMELTRDGF